MSSSTLADTVSHTHTPPVHRLQQASGDVRYVAGTVTGNGLIAKSWAQDWCCRPTQAHLRMRP